MRALARRLLHDGSRAEDVVQDAWLAALSGSRPAEVPLRWWLAGIVRNLVRRLFRSESRRKRRETATARAEATAPDTDMLDRVRLQGHLVEIVLALHEPYRSTLVLRYFEDLTPAEIAARTGVPPGTVRSRLKRGLDQVRSRLDREHEGERRAWAVLLLPLTSGPRPSLPASVLLSGGLLMKTVTKATVILVVLALGAAVWVMVGPGTSPGEPGRKAALPTPPASRTDVSRGASTGKELRANPVRSVATVMVGVLTWAGEPVAGAGVYVRARPAWRNTLEDAPAPLEPLAASETDAAGRAELTGLPAGSFEVLVRAPGHALGRKSLRLGDGEFIEVEVRLQGAFTLRGRITEQDGSPLVDATVQVASGWPFRTRSGAEGQFAFDGLPWGRHEIRVAPPGSTSIPLAHVHVPFAGELLLALPPMGSLEGRVTDSVTGLPHGGAEVTVGLQWGPMRGGRATTDREGRFRIGFLPAGVLRGVTVSRAGYRYRTELRWYDRLVPIRRGETTRRDYELEPAPGTRTPPPPREKAPEWTVTGNVTGAGGSPIGGAQVGSGFTDADGSFRVNGTRTGGIETWFVTADGYVRGEIEVPVPESGETLRIDARLSRSPRVRGRVRRADGGPLPADVSVRVFVRTGRLAPGPAGNPETLIGPMAPVLPDGTCEAEVPWDASGEFRVEVRAPGFEPTDVGPIPIEPGRETYEVEAILERGPSIEGRVLDAETGEPVPGAMVGRTAGSIHEFATSTDEAGRFVLSASSTGAGGLQGLRVRSPGYLDSYPTATPGGGELEVRLAREGAIEGLATFADGRPAAGVRVVAGGPVPAIHFDITEPDGRFRIGGLIPGEYPLFVAPSAIDVDILSERLETAETGEMDVRLVVRGGLRIAGRVLTGDGRPVTDATVRATPADARRGTEFRMTRTSSGGAFVLAGLPEGAFDLDAIPPAGSPYAPEGGSLLPVRLSGVTAGSDGLVLRLPVGLAIEGVLITESGEPLSGMRLEAGGKTAMTGEGGRFRIAGLPAGRHRVRIPPGAASDRAAFLRGGEAVAAGTADLRLVGLPGAVVEGIVMDEAGGPVAGARIAAVSEGGPRRTAASDRRGSFRVGALLPERITIMVSTPGYVPQRIGPVLPGAGPLRVTLERGLALTGLALDEDGRPLARAWIQVVHPGDPLFSRQVRTGDDGRFEVGGLLPGTYRLTTRILVDGKVKELDLGPASAGRSGLEVRPR